MAIPRSATQQLANPAMKLPLHDRIAAFTVRRLMPAPVRTRLGFYSMIFSAEDDGSRPSQRLINLALDAGSKAGSVNLEVIQDRTKDEFVNIWPGEHYRLLAGLMSSLEPKLVVEVGTGGGLSALVIAAHLPPGSKLVTYDVFHWQNPSADWPSYLREEDFSNGKIEFRQADLSNPEQFTTNLDLLEEADLLFIDAAKDGVFEDALLARLEGANFRHAPIVMFDDIRVWNMLATWRRISRPKLDLTSFGHWSGTGLVDWNARG
jgi:predicted O-methyltransferase YrrM